MELVTPAIGNYKILFVAIANFLGVLFLAVFKKSRKEKFKLNLDSDGMGFGAGELVDLGRQVIGFLFFVVAFLGALALLLHQKVLWGFLLLGLFILSIGLAKLIIMLK